MTHIARRPYTTLPDNPYNPSNCQAGKRPFYLKNIIFRTEYFTVSFYFTTFARYFLRKEKLQQIIVNMYKRLLLSVILAAVAVVGWAQNDDSNKLSVTTQMFLQELNGDISFDRDTKAEKQLGLVPVDDSWHKKGKDASRIYASPDTINGKAYIAAYLRLHDATNVAEVEALGVILQSKFNNGLFTSLIPVDVIDKVAAISNVKRINVSPLKRTMTNAARQKTNVDDVLTLSADAISEGLTKKFDGTGVVLGVIDTGIDFAHIAFKDKNGNSRIKKAYVYNGSNAQEYSSITSTTLTDDNSEDHGTHTSTTAGGSSVIVSGTNVTVTDDHANATYGGMAPGADLYLAGINGLSSTYLDNAVNKMCTYADQQGKPLVVSNSWGSQIGPHDGTGDVADVYNSLFGDSHPNRIALFAASNDGGKSKDNEGGGYHVSGTASSSSPLSTIVRSATYINTDAGYMYAGIIANAWARSTSVSKLGIKILVLDASTGAVKTSVTMTSAGSVSGLSTYYSGSLYVYYDQVESDKTQVLLYSSNGITSRSTSTTTKNGETYYTSNYTLAIQVYPTSGSSVVDIWGGSYGYFTNHLTTSGYTWTAGSDDMCVSDEAMIPNVISIGAYVSKNQHYDYSGTLQNHSDEYTIGDIAYFSSYATANASPTGLQYPWITAPGARLAAGVNHNHTTSVDNYSYYGSDYNSDLVVNNSSYPYAMMEGTSMATPTAAGIVALWLQASLEANAQHKNLTVNDVKEIMQLTAINDSYTTTGANASHFGKGKIDALAGIKYILGASSGPTIQVNPTSLEFTGYATQPQTKTITVTGLNLEGNITISKTGSAIFSVNKNTITAAEAANGVELTVTWSPTTAGTSTGTLTLKSTNADNVTISLTGVAEAATPTIISDKTELNLTAGLGKDKSETIQVTGRFLTGNVTATLTDANGVFSISPASLTAATVNGDGGTLTVTFNSSTEGTFTGTLKLSSNGAQSVSIALSATASDVGKASDPYLNIAKYASIDEAGWNTSYVNNLYQYTEYQDEEVAWLTIPIYGAWSGVYYNSHPQKWIDSNVTSTNNKYAGTTWSSSDKLLGNTPYFTSASARAMGYNSRTNSTQETVTFYVTNTTAVKMLGTGQSRASSSYPTTLKVYECTVNSDGSLTASTSAVKSESNSATSGTFVLSATDLDASKVYKVETATYRSYICEVGFQTPIEVVKIPEISATPTSVELSAPIGTSQTSEITVTSSNLTGNVSATISGGNGAFTVNPTTIDKSASNATLTVTFTPQAAQTYNATLTLASEGAESVTISLTGTGLEPVIAATEVLAFNEGTVGETSEKVIEVLAENLAEGITLTLNDENNVFALSKTTLTKAEAQEGTDVTVTFTPAEAKDYTATVTLTSLNAEPVTVSLYGSATPGYFDVTVGSYGLTTMYLDFPVDIPYEEYDPDLLGVYYAYDISNGSMKLARLNSVIPANTGVVVHGNAGTYRFTKSQNNSYQTKYYNYLTGSTVSITPAQALAAAQSDGNVYTMQIGSNGFIAFYRFTGSRLAANKAFLIYNENLSKINIGDNDQVATYIQGISQEEEGSWYTIQGVKLSGKPSQQGIYIFNGKPVSIK